MTQILEPKWARDLDWFVYWHNGKGDGPDEAVAAFKREDDAEEFVERMREVDDTVEYIVVPREDVADVE